MLIGSALASGGSVLEPAGIGSIRHRGSFWDLLTEATPVAPRYQNLATQTQYRLSIGFSTSDHNPLSLVAQPIFFLLSSPLTQSIPHQFGYKDTMRDHSKGHAKVNVSNIHCFPLVHTSRHVIVESSQVGQTQFAFVNPYWLFPITFLSLMYLDMASRKICYITFSGTVVRLTDL